MDSKAHVPPSQILIRDSRIHSLHVLTFFFPQVCFNSLRFCLCCSLDRRTSAKSHACEWLAWQTETSSCIVFDEVLNFVPEILLKQEALRKLMGLDKTCTWKFSTHRPGWVFMIYSRLFCWQYICNIIMFSLSSMFPKDCAGRFVCKGV